MEKTFTSRFFNFNTILMMLLIFNIKRVADSTLNCDTTISCLHNLVWCSQSRPWIAKVLRDFQWIWKFFLLYPSLFCFSKLVSNALSDQRKQTWPGALRQSSHVQMSQSEQVGRWYSGCRYPIWCSYIALYFSKSQWQTSVNHPFHCLAYTNG